MNRMETKLRYHDLFMADKQVGELWVDSVTHYVEWPSVQVVGTLELASVSEYVCLA